MMFPRLFLCPRLPLRSTRTLLGGANLSSSSHLLHREANNGRKSGSSSPPAFKSISEVQQLFKPVAVKRNTEEESLGREITGRTLNKPNMLKLLNAFHQNAEIKKLSKEHGLDDYLYHQAYVAFRKHCLDVEFLRTDLYVLLSDLLQGSGHVTDIFPHFLRYARKVFPHLECLEDLRLISDLTDPPNWYPEARAIQRKIVFHAGPTNSGKTYHALERFTSAKSGVYCGPLKMLAVEVFNKTNAKGVACDLVTGEERRFGRDDEEPSSHVACTVEMTNCQQQYEVAVIDEIQMVKDFQRGWAWTRALLGIPAEEIHVCGEAAAIDLVRELMLSTGEEVEVRNYKRLTELVVMDKALSDLKNVQPGDCIVCFNKQDIYHVSRNLERLGFDVAVIYGSLPPTTKLGMADKFNSPEDPCNVLVATDAVGMGLNLNIRRIVFYSMFKVQFSQEGEKEMKELSVSQALQIAGRAGRFNTKWETGYVTCFNQEEMPIMHELLSQKPDEILQAGLHPTYDQLEMYSYHLPHATLSNLVDIFISLSTLDDSMYNLCQMTDFKFLADMIEHIKLPLKAKHAFCCAPINRRMPLVTTMFLKIVRQYSNGELITFDWLSHQVGWPFSPPDTIIDLVQLESVHDVLDLYLWLSYRFQDSFPDVELVRNIQQELDIVIEEGVSNIVQLLKNSEPSEKKGEAKKERTRKKPSANEILQGMSNVMTEGMSEEDVEAVKEFAKDMQGKKKKKKLTNQLLNQGLLTKQMIQTLQGEWEKKTRNK